MPQRRTCPRTRSSSLDEPHAPPWAEKRGGQGLTLDEGVTWMIARFTG